MTLKSNSKATGKRSETIAIQWLKENDYSILKTNYTTPYGEVDIIAKHGETTVFIEVKSAIGHDPIEAVTQSKIKKIRNVALYYMQTLGQEIKIRFDVITITLNEGDLKLQHISDAF